MPVMVNLVIHVFNVTYSAKIWNFPELSKLFRIKVTYVLTTFPAVGLKIGQLEISYTSLSNGKRVGGEALLHHDLSSILDICTLLRGLLSIVSPSWHIQLPGTAEKLYRQ